MPQIDKDWMLTAGAWTRFTVNAGSQSLVPLTSFLSQELSASVAAPSWFESGDSFLLERIIGSIYVIHPEMVATAAYEQPVHLAIDMLDTDVDGQPAIPGNYDWEDPLTANRAFLWHYYQLGFNSLNWWSDNVQGGGMYERIPVDVKTKRRVETNKSPFLIIQNVLTTESGRVYCAINLRCLGSKVM